MNKQQLYYGHLILCLMSAHFSSASCNESEDVKARDCRVCMWVHMCADGVAVGSLCLCSVKYKNCCFTAKLTSQTQAHIQRRYTHRGASLIYKDIIQLRSHTCSVLGSDAVGRVVPVVWAGPVGAVL